MTALRRIGLFAAAIVILIVLLVWSLPLTMRLGLMVAGLDDVVFDSLDVGLRSTRVDALVIGEPPRQRVATIRADYGLRGLLEGRLDRLLIDGMAIKASYRDGKLSFNDAAPPETDGGGLIGGDARHPEMPFAVDILEIENSRIDIETAAGFVTLPVNGRVEVVDERLQFQVDSPSMTLAAGGPKMLEATLKIEGHLPLGATPSADQLVVAASIDLRAADMAWADWSERLSMTSAFDLSLSNSRLTLEGPVKISGQTSSADGHVRAAVTLDKRMRPVAIESSEAVFDLGTIAFDDVGLGEGGLQRGHLALQLQGAPNAPTGTLAVDLEDLAVEFDGVDVQGIKMRRIFNLAVRDHAIDVSAREDSDKISVDQVTIEIDDDRSIESGWFTIQWPSRDTPWLQVDLKKQRFSLDSAIEIDPLRIDHPAGRLWARVEDLALTLTGDAGGLQEASVRLRQGRADLPSANLALLGIESDVLMRGRKLAADQSIPLTIRTVRSLDEPHLFAPLRLDAGIDADGRTFSTNGKLTSRSQPSVTFSFAGRHDIETGRGALDLDLATLDFSSGQLKPDDLLPVLDGVISDATGSISLGGNVTWAEGKFESDIALLIEELGFAIGPARLSRINSVIQFDGMAPPSTPRDQLLSVGLLDLGLPLTDGLVTMQLRPDGKLTVDQLAWRLADGRVRAEPFSFGSDVQSLTLMLQAERLDLDTLLGLTPLDDLTGEGRLDGTLPLTVGETAAIADGKLANTGPGILRYKPTTVPDVLRAGGESVGIMLQALENFHYDALEITLDGDTDGATAIGLHLKGANPDLYDGHPVEFNLNLEGNLANLLRTNLDSYQIPDRIRERIQGFQR